MATIANILQIHDIMYKMKLHRITTAVSNPGYLRSIEFMTKVLSTFFRQKDAEEQKINEQTYRLVGDRSRTNWLLIRFLYLGNLQKLKKTSFILIVKNKLFV